MPITNAFILCVLFKTKDCLDDQFKKCVFLSLIYSVDYNKAKKSKYSQFKISTQQMLGLCKGS